MPRLVPSGPSDENYFTSLRRFKESVTARRAEKESNGANKNAGSEANENSGREQKGSNATGSPAATGVVTDPREPGKGPNGVARLFPPRTRKIPLQPRTRDENSPRLVVCHDYKGGYYEDDFECHYAFVHWHYADSFIYFAHHRVSFPPAPWIRTAHKLGTRILGTVIFEHTEGEQDLWELLAAGHGPEYAEMLSAEARHRGFDGYLINVETKTLGGTFTDERGDTVVWTPEEQAEKLREWVEYFTELFPKYVPGGEVMWYDAITNEGKRHWQNKLSEKNLEFFLSASSMFTNYFWKPLYLTASLDMLETFGIAHQSNRLLFGIDVWGRGTYGGGGWDVWKALDCIQGAVSSGNAKGELSAAVFGPGWTAESDKLGHVLSTPEGARAWLKDDLLLWSGERISPLSDSEKNTRFLVQRETSMFSSISGSYHPFGVQESLFGYRPIGSFHDAPLAAVSEDVFFSCFSTGSGHSFYIEGSNVYEKAACEYRTVMSRGGKANNGAAGAEAAQIIPHDGKEIATENSSVKDDELLETLATSTATASRPNTPSPHRLSHKGYTDIDMAYALPSLLDRWTPLRNVSAELTDSDAWLGNMSTMIKVVFEKSDSSRDIKIPLCPVAFKTAQETYTCKMVYKVAHIPEILCAAEPYAEFTKAGRVEVHSPTERELSNGWRECCGVLSGDDPIAVGARLVLKRTTSVEHKSTLNILVGAICIQSKERVSFTLEPQWKAENRLLVWESVPDHIFTIVRLDNQFLGTTVDPFFYIPSPNGGTVTCQGVLSNGVLDAISSGVLIPL